MLNEDIIPIAFMGGTGGNFLCHFIVSAKRKDKTSLDFSLHGNAHKGYKEIRSPALGVHEPDSDKLHFLLSQEMSNKVESPYYTVVHFTETKTIANNFKKSIRITFDKDDIETLAYVFLGKHHIDTLDTIPTLTKNNIWVLTKNDFNKWQHYFEKEDYPNVLFISWKELFLGDADMLLNKISEYTDIDSIYFLKDSLLEWRTATHQCIDSLKTELETFKRIHL